MLRITRAAVDAVDPYRLAQSAFASHPLFNSSESISLVATGKGAWPMARGAADLLGARVRCGVVVGARSEGPLPGVVSHFEPPHPLPDESSVEAGSRALAIAHEAARRRETLVVLLSGGASAMLAAPAPGVTLENKRRTTDLLLRSGVDIQRVNCVRKHLSAIKGGQLGRAAGRCLTLAISDVHEPPDDPATIGSGPTVADPTTYGEALAVVQPMAADLPAAVERHLARGMAGELPETPKPGDPALADCAFQIIGNRRTAMAGAALEAERLGYAVRVVETATRGEARDAGRLFAERAFTAGRVAAGPSCIIASGEPTVTVRGSGVGGRNQEFALGAAHMLARSDAPAVLASVGTDGIDGPTDAAGAIVTSVTVRRAHALGLDIGDALRRNDAYPLLRTLDALVKWGPTFTNVGDIHVVLTMKP